MNPLLIASLLSGGISAVNGLIQKKQGKDIAKNNAYPEQKIPQAILDNSEKAKLYENQGLPSEQYQQAINNINRNSTAALRSATDRRGGLGLISTIQQGANDAKLGLDVANANAVRQNQQRAMQQNNVLGGWQNNVWDWNKRQKYLQTAASARSLIGAGNQNINGGLDRALGGLLMSGLGGKKTETESPNGGSNMGTSNGYQDIQGTVNQDDFNLPNAPQKFNADNSNYNAIMGLSKPNPFMYNQSRFRRI